MKQPPDRLLSKNNGKVISERVLSLSIYPVALICVIEAALETVRLSAEAKSVQIQTVLEADVGQVLGDSSRLQQIVWNLLSNAVKFTPGGGRVEVRLSMVNGSVVHGEANPPETADPPEGEGAGGELSPTTYYLPSIRYAQIAAHDTGKGIDPDFLPYVFDYFRQENSTTTRKFGGLGLGLTIVRHLVELHGGTVFAESPGEGQGAVFTVRLPVS